MAAPVVSGTVALMLQANPKLTPNLVKGILQYTAQVYPGYNALLQEGAELVLQFVFETLGAHRLEARAALRNGRGNGALRKIGAVQEGVLRRSFLRNGEHLDQALYAIVDDDWRASRSMAREQVTVVH